MKQLFMQSNQRNNDNSNSFYLYLPGSGKLSFLLPRVTHISSSKHYINVQVHALTHLLCKFHMLYAITPLHLQCLHCILNLHLRCSQSSLAASLGREPWAGLCCLGCHFLAPCTISALGISVSRTSWRAWMCMHEPPLLTEL